MSDLYCCRLLPFDGVKPPGVKFSASLELTVLSNVHEDARPRIWFKPLPLFACKTLVVWVAVPLAPAT